MWSGINKEFGRSHNSYNRHIFILCKKPTLHLDLQARYWKLMFTKKLLQRFSGSPGPQPAELSQAQPRIKRRLSKPRRFLRTCRVVWFCLVGKLWFHFLKRICRFFQWHPGWWIYHSRIHMLHAEYLGTFWSNSWSRNGCNTYSIFLARAATVRAALRMPAQAKKRCIFI